MKIWHLSLLLKSSPKHVILRPAFKPTLLSPSNILKKQLAKSHPLKTDRKGFLVLLDVQSLLPLDKLTPKLAFVSDVRPILLIVPALLRMTHVMPVENVDTGNRCARRLLSKLYLMWNRILTPTFFNPLISSRMMSVKSHLYRKVSLLTLTSVLLHHHLSSASSFRLTQAARATPCMSETLTNYLQCQWNHLQFVSLITQKQSSQPPGKLHCSALAVENPMRL